MTKEEKMAEHFESVIDRELYRRIKRMDRKHTNDVFRYIYEKGWDDSLSENGKNADLLKLRSEISSIKGIGDTRLEQIMEIIERSI